MPTKIVVGVQWGDEGKGKIIDILAEKADIVVRSQGGNNAGHTVEHSNETYKLHLIPSGILYPETLCLIGCGVALDPKALLSEIDNLKARGITCNNLRIDPRAHVIMPWHIKMDILSEQARGKDLEIGTTKRGIGPCYMDKAERIGIRMYDLINHYILKEKVENIGSQKNNIFTKIYNSDTIDLDNIYNEYFELGKRLAKYVDDVSLITYQAYKQNKNILFEGAQGTLLDLDTGTYPFVTSSHPVSAGACIGTGIGPNFINEVIGVAKAYSTRVGKGPFPTELDNDIGELIRKRGKEFGTTTGRPRRTGWFDALVVKHAIRVNGLTGLAINKIDTLTNFEEINVCVAYKKPDGTIINDFPPTIEDLSVCEPIYETIKGFDGDIARCKRFIDLPLQCKNYISKLEQICNCPIIMVGIGPGRSQNLERKSTTF